MASDDALCFFDIVVALMQDNLDVIGFLSSFLREIWIVDCGTRCRSFFDEMKMQAIKLFDEMMVMVLF